MNRLIKFKAYFSGASGWRIERCVKTREITCQAHFEDCMGKKKMQL